jgi:hypothetical protein
MALEIQFQVDIREQGIVVELFQKLEDAFVIAAVMEEWMVFSSICVPQIIYLTVNGGSNTPAQIPK